MESSVNSCIRFRYTEEKVRYELAAELARRSAALAYMRVHMPCDKCGSYSRVLGDICTRQLECEQCWVRRRTGELWSEACP